MLFSPEDPLGSSPRVDSSELGVREERWWDDIYLDEAPQWRLLYQVVLIIFLVIVMQCVGGWLLLLPQWERLEQLKQQQVELMDAIDVRLRKMASLSQVGVPRESVCLQPEKGGGEVFLADTEVRSLRFLGVVQSAGRVTALVRADDGRIAPLSLGDSLGERGGVVSGITQEHLWIDEYYLDREARRAEVIDEHPPNEDACWRIRSVQLALDKKRRRGGQNE